MIFQRWGFLLNIFFTFLINLNVTPSDGSKLSESMVTMKAAKDKILNGYDKYIRPTMDNSNTTTVFTLLAPSQIISVDEENGLFTLDSYIFMIWDDPRLNWSLSEVNYDGYLQLQPDLLWLPDISVYNSHSQMINPKKDALILVTSIGRVYWYTPFLTQTYCHGLMGSTYPYGEVECNLIIGSWAHDGYSLDYKPHESVQTDFFYNTNSKWELLVDKVRIVRNVSDYADHDNDKFTHLTASFPIKRRPLPEIEVTRSPCILVMLLTLSVFFLPPNSTKKIHLLGIMFIILTVLLVYVSWSTKYGIRVLVAVSFLQSTLYIIAVTFLLQVLVIFNLCNLTGPIRPPPAAMQLLTGSLGNYMCLQWPLDSHSNLYLDRMQLKNDESPSKHSPTPNEDWLLFAAGLDRLFFVIVSIAMIAIHHL